MNPSAGYSLSPEWQIARLRLSESESLRYGVYEKTPGNARQALVFINGRGEFIEKYHYFIDDLGLADSCKVLTWDHRGQGGSPGQRSYIDHYETYSKDAQLVLGHCLSPATPYCVVAHSMGALITLYATLAGYVKPQKIILTSPFLGFPNEPLPGWLSPLLAHGLTVLGQGRRHLDQKPRPLAGFANNHLTNCEDKFARMLASPYPGTSVTFAWVKASFEALRYVFRSTALQKLETPVHILYAENERVVTNAAILRWVDKARCYSKSSISCEIIPDAKHELLSETAPIYGMTLQKIKKVLDPWLLNADIS